MTKTHVFALLSADFVLAKNALKRAVARLESISD